MNESAFILSAFENRLRAALVMQTNPAVEQKTEVQIRHKLSDTQ